MDINEKIARGIVKNTLKKLFCVGRILISKDPTLLEDSIIVEQIVGNEKCPLLVVETKSGHKITMTGLEIQKYFSDGGINEKRKQ